MSHVPAFYHLAARESPPLSFVLRFLLSFYPSSRDGLAVPIFPLSFSRFVAGSAPLFAWSVEL